MLLVRARHDPAINQANPATLRDLAVRRRRADNTTSPALWPRQAPVWLQLANWFEYADWQVALSLAPTSFQPSWRVRRSTLRLRRARVCSAARGIACGTRAAGARWSCSSSVRIARRHRVPEPQGGCVVRVGVLPDAARRTRRASATTSSCSDFWAWGVWAGMGAVALAQRCRARRRLVLALPRSARAELGDRDAAPRAGSELPRGSRMAIARSASAARGALRRRRQRHLPAVVCSAGRGTSRGRHDRHDAACSARRGTSPSLSGARI